MTDEAASGASLASPEQGPGASEASTKPLLHVVQKDATPEEVAALVAVLSSLGGEDAAPPRRTPEWQAHHRKLRAHHPHGPGGWRSSGLPR